MKFSKHCIFLISLAITFGCCEKEPKQEINIYETYKNKKHYEVNIGDTINIYHFHQPIPFTYHWELDTIKKLSHLQYFSSKTVYVECLGCTTITEEKFISTSKGKDTFFIPYLNF